MPGQRFPEYANDFQKDDLLQLLLALQGKVNRELHVGTLCVIDTQLSDMSFRATAFPKTKGRDAATFNIICIRQHDATLLRKALEDGQKIICVAMMTDLDSQANQEYIASKHAFEAVESDSQLHSLNNAVLTYIGDCVSGKPIDDYEGE